MLKTEYILYIATNARYGCSFDDAKDFNKALDVFSGFPNLSPLSLEGEAYQTDYISGMYPELESAIQYFFGKVYPSLSKGKLIPDETLRRYANDTIKKFKLQSGYDLDKAPNNVQLARLNDRMFLKQKKDLEKFAPEFLKELGLATIEISKDFRIVHKFMCYFDVIERILSGEISKDNAKEFMDIPGVEQGLTLLSLVEQNIIDKNLHILDWDRLCQSPQIAEFEVVKGKKYNFAVVLNKQRKQQKSQRFKREKGSIGKMFDFIDKIFKDR